MTAIVFAGPSLHGIDRGNWPGIEFRPPAMQGDVFRACAARPAAIGIIDGYFDGVPSVWHKEILWALSQGIIVAGSSSMGALRAAELDTFGMRGIGQIYAWYREGVLEDDDEVALVHGPVETGYLPLSEPMVNVRATCTAAQAAGVLGGEDTHALIAVAKSLHYRDRNWKAIFKSLSEDAERGDRWKPVRQWVRTGAVDQKRADALELLAAIAGSGMEAVEEGGPSFRFEWTDLWERALQDWEMRDRLQDSADDRLVLDELRLDPALFAEIRSDAISRSILLREAGRRALGVDRPEMLAALKRLRNAHGLGRKADLNEWASRNAFTGETFDAFIQEEALAEKARHLASFTAMGRHMIAALKTRGLFAALRERAEAKQDALRLLDARTESVVSGRLAPPALLNWFFATMRQPHGAHDIDLLLQTVDLQSRQELYRLLHDEYVYSTTRGEKDSGS